MNQKRDFDPIPKHLERQYSEGIQGLGYERDFEYTNLNDENTSSFEDGRITKLLFETHRMIEHIRLQLIIVITILLIIDFDEQYFIIEDNIILWLAFFLNCILIILTYLTYSVKFNYFKATLLVPPHLSFYQGDFLIPFLIELFIFLPIPNVFVKDIQFEFTLYRIDGIFYYSMNDILFLFTCLRSVNLLFILLRLSYIYNSQVHRISLYFGFRIKWSFTFKSLTSEQPVLVITTIFTIQTIYLTLALWIVERPFERDLHSNTLRLLKHCFYETILALIRYSYEEYEPYTVLGKIVLAFTQYSGFATTSLLIAAIAARFQMFPNEYNTFILLQRMEASNEMLRISQCIGEQFYYLMKYPVNPFTNQRAKLCLMYLKEFFHLKRNYQNTIGELAEQLFNRKLKEMKLQIEEYQEIIKLLAQQQKEIWIFAQFSGNYINKSQFDNLLQIDQDLLMIMIDNDELVALWNKMYQNNSEKYQMSVIDCRQVKDLCEFLQIDSLPLFLYVDKLTRTFEYNDGPWNEQALQSWLQGDDHHDHSEEEIEIIIEVDQPNIEQNVQWVTDVEVDHIHDDHHSENFEKTQYQELQNLIELNEQLSFKAQKFNRELESLTKQLDKLDEELSKPIISKSDNFSIYLYCLGAITFVCVVFSWKKINVYAKKSSILIQ